MPMTTNLMHISKEAAAKSSDDVVDLFQRMPDFTKFNEAHNPIAAMLWINHLEDIFHVFKCPDKHKVLYASFMLRSGAEVWWALVQNLRGRETTVKMTWSEFKEVFKDRFYPISMEMTLVEEHMSLKQGTNQSVEEYISRFEELWWFVWHYLMPEKRLTYMFVRGLKDDIKKFISPSDMTSFENVVKVARLVENENNRRRKWKSEE